MKLPLKPRGRRQPLKAGRTVFGERRVALGLSQRDVARITGMSGGILSMIESGRMNPTTEEASRLMGLYAQLEYERSSDPLASGEG